jgi:hypothetical protein
MTSEYVANRLPIYAQLWFVMPFAISSYVTCSRKSTSLPKLSTVPFGVLSRISERLVSAPLLVGMLKLD